MTSPPIIPYGRQTIDDDDVQAVVDVLRSDYLTTGPAVTAFEASVAEYVGARHAVSFSNATAGLHGCTAAAGLGSGDVVVTSPLTFLASANCARYVGADVQLVDIDPDTLNLDLKSVPHDADALVAVHFAGLPVDLAQLTHRPRIVIEDAAQALGAWTKDGPVGNCAHSDMTCFSFHPVKPITTGEGGVVTTNDDELATRLRRFRSHGIEQRPDEGGWYYSAVDVGYNYRLTDLQAALGRSQMNKIDAFIARRQQLAARYDTALVDFPLIAAPPSLPGSGHGYHLYTIRIGQRRKVYDRLRDRGIYTQVHYVPIHHHPTFHHLGAEMPEADRAYEGLLTLPLYPALSDDDQDRVISTLLDVIDELGITIAPSR